MANNKETQHLVTIKQGRFFIFNLIEFLIQVLQGVSKFNSTWSFRVSVSFYHVPLPCPRSLFHLHGRNRLLLDPGFSIWEKKKRGLARYENDINFPGHIPLAKVHHMTHLTSKEAEKCSQTVECFAQV